MDIGNSSGISKLNTAVAKNTKATEIANKVTLAALQDLQNSLHGNFSKPSDVSSLARLSRQWIHC
jgi:hypothetical protein